MKLLDWLDIGTALLLFLAAVGSSDPAARAVFAVSTVFMLRLARFR